MKDIPSVTLQAPYQWTTITSQDLMKEAKLQLSGKHTTTCSSTKPDFGCKRKEQRKKKTPMMYTYTQDITELWSNVSSVCQCGQCYAQLSVLSISCQCYMQLSSRFCDVLGVHHVCPLLLLLLSSATKVCFGRTTASILLPYAFTFPKYFARRRKKVKTLTLQNWT